MKQVQRALSLGLTALVLVACGDRETSEEVVTETGLSPAALAGARITLSSLDSLSFDLSEGVAHSPDGGKVTLLPAYVVEGDFDSDGVRETAALVVSEPGGTGVFLNLLAFQSGPDGAPVQVADRVLGDRQRVHRVEVVADSLLIELTTQGPGDAACCPTRRAEQVYRITDGVWRMWRDITMSAAPPDIQDGVQRRDSTLARPGPIRPLRSG